jgi:hypothetical protein
MTPLHSLNYPPTKIRVVQIQKIMSIFTNYHPNVRAILLNTYNVVHSTFQVGMHATSAPPGNPATGALPAANSSS